MLKNIMHKYASNANKQSSKYLRKAWKIDFFSINERTGE